MNGVEIVDPGDAQARLDYERAFYAAFAGVTTNRLIRTLWRWDEPAGRLATRVPYEDQVIYVARATDGRIETAIAANTALRAFQSSAFGFEPPAEKAGCCEFLTFFTVGDHRLANKLRFWEGCFQDLRRRGFRTAYASTASRVLPTYRRIGGEVIGETMISDEARYFLRFHLERHWMRRG